MSTTSSPTPFDASFVCASYSPSACLNETFYKEHDGQPYCVLHYPGTEKTEDFKKSLEIKLHDKDCDFQGVWFPDEVSFAGVTFSKEADFSDAQFNSYARFEDAEFSMGANFINAKFSKSADFSDVLFNDGVSFNNAQFTGDAYFSHVLFRKGSFFGDAQFIGDAKFGSVHFMGDANFIDVRFNAEAFFRNASFVAAAHFNNAQFSAKADFANARFLSGTTFNRAQFNADADFYMVRFNTLVIFNDAVFRATVKFHETNFLTKDSSHSDSLLSDEIRVAGYAVKAKAKTVEVSFDGAIFKDGVSFKENKFAEQVLMSFDAASFDKPERAIFHTMPLRPHWFINVDSRKFTFINVNWGFLDKRDAVFREINEMRWYPSSLLEITFRQLAVNAEENNRYEEAANFRYMAMEMKRLQRWRKIDLFRLSWWYWLLSGYGERVTRALFALLTIWLLFALIYFSGNATWWQPKQSAKLAAQSSEPAPAAKDSPPPTTAAAPLTFPEALIYSAGVMTLQKPEPLPANKRAKAFVLLETVLGPLQAALLALAIRRKFMR